MFTLSNTSTDTEHFLTRLAIVLCRGQMCKGPHAQWNVITVNSKQLSFENCFSSNPGVFLKRPLAVFNSATVLFEPPLMITLI